MYTFTGEPYYSFPTPHFNLCTLHDSIPNDPYQSSCRFSVHSLSSPVYFLSSFFEATFCINGGHSPCPLLLKWSISVIKYNRFFSFFLNSLKFHKSRQTNISKLTYIFTWLPQRALRSSLPRWTLTNTDCKHSATAHHSDSKIFSNEQLTKNKKKIK